MNQAPNMHIAVCCHGFLGDPGMMNEIVTTLKGDPYDEIYDDISNITYYSSKHGVNFTQPYDLKTPIYQEGTKQTLAHHFFKKICQELDKFEEEVKLDIFAHSMGGLVTRSIVKYLSEEKRDGIWIQNGLIRNIFLLGTPNHGTRLAQRGINVPADILMTGLNLLLELPDGVTSEDLQILKSQFMQMIPNSSFLRELNQRSKNIEDYITWVTVRGLKWTGQLTMVWQPFLFRKFWINRQFPFVHMGIISNDGFVDANRVPLKYATNLTVPSATHMDLLNWKSKKPGKQVQKLLRPIILAEKKKISLISD